MSTWRYLTSLSWTFKWTLALDFIGTVVVVVGLEQAFALTLREVFNTLTGDALTSLSVWTLCAVLVGFAAARFAVFVGTYALLFANEFMIGALLRRNVLAHLMNMSGGRNLPASSGEAVTRFRGDASSVGVFLIVSTFIASEFVFAAVAVFIMIRISPLITLVAFCPSHFGSHCLYRSQSPYFKDAKEKPRSNWGRGRSPRRDVRIRRDDQGRWSRAPCPWRVRPCERGAQTRWPERHAANSHTRRHLPQRAELRHGRNSDRCRPGDTQWTVHRWRPRAIRLLFGGVHDAFREHR